MKISKIALATSIAGLLMVSQAHARGTVTGKIERISTGSAINVYFDTDITDGSDGGIPACTTASNFMSLDASKKNELAILLTALALGSEVKVSGTSACTVRATSEDIGQVQVFSE